VIEGFGASGRLRTSRFPDAASGLPIALELIDLPERVESFLATVQRMAPGSLVTREQVQMKRREEPPSAGLDDPEPPSRQI
jgi:PII-like signaling protein